MGATTKPEPADVRWSVVPVTVGWPNFLHVVAVKQFLAAGWTRQDWQDCWAMTGASRLRTNQDSADLRDWLMQPPATFTARVTPALVQATITAHAGVQHAGGWPWGRAARILTAYAAGASERFADASLSAQPDARVDLVWAYATGLGLGEAAATGWALTGWLVEEGNLVEDLKAQYNERDIGLWAKRFGPDAYLWPLAGFTLGEATAVKAASVPLTNEQLRVMAALNGTTLPCRDLTAKRRVETKEGGATGVEHAG